VGAGGPADDLDAFRKILDTNAVPLGLVQRPGRPGWPSREAEVAAEHPAGRLGTPDDVGEAASYPLGDGAGWVTGQTPVLDGGRLSRGR
jgi:NAD(P)-dependent dehydrogenase (short-subunit alcohol dehydrogenase family)